MNAGHIWIGLAVLAIFGCIAFGIVEGSRRLKEWLDQ